MWRSIVGVAVALAVALPAMAADWQVLDDRRFEFRLDVPTEPLKEARDVKAPAESLIYSGRDDSDEGMLVFTMTVMDFGPGGLGPIPDEMVAKTMLRGAGEGNELVGGMEPLTVSGLPAWSQRMKLGPDRRDTLAIATRKGDTAYLLIVSNEPGRQDEADRIVDSLEIGASI